MLPSYFLKNIFLFFSPIILATGIGTLFLWLLMVSFGIYVEKLATKNTCQPHKSKIVMKIARFALIIAFLVFGCLQFLKVKGFFSAYLKITSAILVNFFNFIFTILIPALVISRNDNLNAFVNAFFDNMLPIIYIPNAVPNLVNRSQARIYTLNV